MRRWINSTQAHSSWSVRSNSRANNYSLKLLSHLLSYNKNVWKKLEKLQKISTSKRVASVAHRIARRSGGIKRFATNAAVKRWAFAQTRLAMHNFPCKHHGYWLEWLFITLERKLGSDSLKTPYIPRCNKRSF